MHDLNHGHTTHELAAYAAILILMAWDTLRLCLMPDSMGYPMCLCALVGISRLSRPERPRTSRIVDPRCVCVSITHSTLQCTATHSETESEIRGESIDYCCPVYAFLNPFPSSVLRPYHLAYGQITFTVITFWTCVGCMPFGATAKFGSRGDGGWKCTKVSI